MHTRTNMSTLFKVVSRIESGTRPFLLSLSLDGLNRTVWIEDIGIWVHLGVMRYIPEVRQPLATPSPRINLPWVRKNHCAFGNEVPLICIVLGHLMRKSGIEWEFEPPTPVCMFGHLELTVREDRMPSWSREVFVQFMVSRLGLQDVVDGHSLWPSWILPEFVTVRQGRGSLPFKNLSRNDWVCKPVRLNVCRDPRMSPHRIRSS